MNIFDEWMRKLHEMKDHDPENAMPESLVTTGDSARWLESDVTGNPCRIGILLEVPARSMELYLQELPAGTATDLQRHPHESVHCVTAGSGYSEIGPRTVYWKAGDFIYTPPSVWHRHYNHGDVAVHMILVENSPLLSVLGVARRDSAGNIPYKDLDHD